MESVLTSATQRCAFVAVVCSLHQEDHLPALLFPKFEVNRCMRSAALIPDCNRAVNRRSISSGDGGLAGKEECSIDRLG